MLSSGIYSGLLAFVSVLRLWGLTTVENFRLVNMTFRLKHRRTVRGLFAMATTLRNPHR